MRKITVVTDGLPKQVLKEQHNLLKAFMLVSTATETVSMIFGDIEGNDPEDIVTTFKSEHGVEVIDYSVKDDTLTINITGATAVYLASKLEEDDQEEVGEEDKEFGPVYQLTVVALEEGETLPSSRSLKIVVSGTANLKSEMIKALDFIKTVGDKERLTYSFVFDGTEADLKYMNEGFEKEYGITIKSYIKEGKMFIEADGVNARKLVGYMEEMAQPAEDYYKQVADANEEVMYLDLVIEPIVTVVPTHKICVGVDITDSSQFDVSILFPILGVENPTYRVGLVVDTTHFKKDIKELSIIFMCHKYNNTEEEEKAIKEILSSHKEVLYMDYRHRFYTI